MNGTVLNSNACFFKVPTGTVPYMSKIPTALDCLQRRNFANGGTVLNSYFCFFLNILPRLIRDHGRIQIAEPARIIRAFHIECIDHDRPDPDLSGAEGISRRAD